MQLEARAKAFASARHADIGQVRAFTGEPYINHPAAVVEIVRRTPHTESMLAAAWLHDTVKDTPTTLEQIENLFGTEVMELVEMLTDISKPEDGDRASRKALDRAHTAQASAQAKTLKLADVIENCATIARMDFKFTRGYLTEKALLLNVLTEGDSSLWHEAKGIIEAGLSRVAE